MYDHPNFVHSVDQNAREWQSLVTFLNDEMNGPRRNSDQWVNVRTFS